MYSTLAPNRLRTPALMGLGIDATLASGLTGGVVSAAVGLASTALGSWLADKRANAQAKIYSTSIVNELEPLLNANKNAYLSGPGTCADQAMALAAFDSAMAWLQTPQACGNLQLGTAGQNCINDRLPGGKWDWYRAYRDPIANDPRPQCNLADDAAGQSAAQNILNKISGSNVQTNPQMFVSTGAMTNNTGSTTTSVISTNGTVMNIPTSYLVMGGAALLLVLILS